MCHSAAGLCPCSATQCCWPSCMVREAAPAGLKNGMVPTRTFRDRTPKTGSQQTLRLGRGVGSGWSVSLTRPVFERQQFLLQGSTLKRTNAFSGVVVGPEYLCHPVQAAQSSLTRPVLGGLRVVLAVLSICSGEQSVVLCAYSSECWLCCLGCKVWGAKRRCDAQLRGAHVLVADR